MRDRLWHDCLDQFYYQSRLQSLFTAMKIDLSTDTISNTVEFQALFERVCPFCLNELIHFDHIASWKCTCGFKVTDHKLDEMCATLLLEPEHRTITGFNSGFSFVNYTDDEPF